MSSSPDEPDYTASLTMKPDDTSPLDATSSSHSAPKPAIKALDLHAVMDGMSEGVALLDSDFTVLDINAQAMRLTSRSRDAIVGRSHWDAFPGTEHSELGALYKKAMREGVPVAFEHRHDWDDGRASWLDMRAFPVGEGQLAIFFRDITKKREAERALRESEQRFRGAVDAFTDALWTNDANGQMIGEQPGWAALTGQMRDEYQGYGWSRAVHPDDAQPTIDAWELSVMEQRPFEFEHRVKTYSGGWRRFSIRAVPVFGDDGTIREWVGVHRDITESTEARLQLARNADTFQSLVRDNPFGIYVVDSDFHLVHVSQGCAKIFAGIAPLLGRDFEQILREIWNETFAAEAISRFRDTLHTGEPFASHRTVEQRGNIEAVEAYDWRIDRIILPDGKFGVVCYFYDLSERVELEDSLRRAIDDKDVLLREIDHRVRNSMSLVSALLSMQGTASKSPKVKQAIAVAVARMQAVARIHERLYKGKTIGVIQLDEYLSQICNDLHASLASDGVRIQFETVAVQMSVDHAIPLGLVTNELVTNAFKHCHGSDLVIRVTLANIPGGYSLRVVDDGVGMPDKFVAGSGDGIGMKVVRLLTRQIGGTIDFPAPGAAADFTVFIPQQLAITQGS